jgi:hypothetical protein
MITCSSPVLWLLSSPSISVLLARRGWPFTSTDSESCELKNAEWLRAGRVAPGTVTSSDWKLRLKVSGSSATIFDSMMRPVSVRSVCSSGVSAATVTVSFSCPTSSLRSTRTVVLTSTRTLSRMTFLNPCSSASTA